MDACAELGTEVVRRGTGLLERGPAIHRPIQFREAAEALRRLLGPGFPGVTEEMRERLAEGSGSARPTTARHSSSARRCERSSWT